MLKICAITTCTFASFYTICQHSNHFKGNVLFRLGRTIFTVTSMTVGYKIFYYSTDEKDLNYSSLLSNVHKKSAEKLLSLSISNGGCYIKIGQHLGSLTYLLPEEYVNTLRILHDNVPNESFDNVYKIIREEIGVEPFEVFSEIASYPIGTASLAQVHYGKLKNSNIEVAIKVQHREVKDHAYIDLMCMDTLFSIISRLFPHMNLQWLAEETRKNLPNELNFLLEGQNAENLRDRLSRKLPFLKIPKIFWNLSTEKLLVMEYCHGGKITDRFYIETNGLSNKEISQNMCKLYSEMIFSQGFFHSDPHPGNILIRPAKTEKKSWIMEALSALRINRIKPAEIVLLDHGLYQTLTDDFLFHYSRLWIHIINGDENGIQQEGMALGCQQNLHRLLACMVVGRSWQAVKNGISDVVFSSEESQHMRTNANIYLKEMINILNSVPREMLLILKTNDLLRGIEHSLMGTPYNKATLGVITMTRYCISRIKEEEIQLLLKEGVSFIIRIQCMALKIKLFWHLFVLRICSSFI